MAPVDKSLQRMRAQPVGVRFADLKKVFDAYFGKPRQAASSHIVYKTPWPGDPRVNIQNTGGNAKPFQVRQVLSAVDRMEQLRKGKA